MDATPEANAIAQFEAAADKLREIEGTLEPDDPILRPLIRTELDQIDRFMQMVERIEIELPVDEELTAAVTPMSHGRFEEARLLLKVYKQHHADSQMTAFAGALCDLELGSYATAHQALARAFPQEEGYPAVRFLKLFSEKLSQHATPDADVIADTAAWAHATVRLAMKRARPETRFLLSDPTVNDLALMRFMLLTDFAQGPLHISMGRMMWAASTVESPWLPVAMDKLLPGMSDGMSKDEIRGWRLIEILSDWYGDEKRYEKDTPARIAALDELKRLDPGNGAWTLLEIPYNGEVTDDDEVNWMPLTSRELRLFFSAIERNDIRLEYAEIQRAAIEAFQASGFPYVDLMLRHLLPSYHVYYHTRNIMQRAERAGRLAIESGDHDAAIRISDCIVRFADALWLNDQRAFLSRARSYAYGGMGRSLRAEAYRENPPQHAASLRKLAEYRLRDYAFRASSRGGALFDALPLAMLRAALLESDSAEDHHRRAAAMLRIDSLETKSLIDWFAKHWVHRRQIMQAAITDLVEATPLITEHIDSYETDEPWQAVWLLGKLGDKRAEAKLRKLRTSDDPVIRSMAEWSLTQLR